MLLSGRNEAIHGASAPTVDRAREYDFFGVAAATGRTYALKGMDVRVREGSSALTEKEKQTLRLMVRGHDAKSIASSLGLSVHTINERLRDARRKMAVSSSREAARLLLEAEEGGGCPPTPDLLVDAQIGEDAARTQMDQGTAPTGGAGLAQRRPWIIGVLLMTLVLDLVAFTILSGIASGSSQAPVTAGAATNAEVVETARRWLVLVDQRKWDESYRGTGGSFRRLNTAQVWAETNEKVRVPLSAVISRTFASYQNLPAPPHGYEVVKFRTRFANRADTVEIVTLNREDGGWYVVGVTIE